MPGLSILIGKKPNKKSEYILSHNGNNEVKKLYQDDLISVYFNGYESYPIEMLNDKNYLVLIEGMIYNASDKNIREELENMIQSESSFENICHKMQKFMQNYWGEYLIFLYSKITRVYYIFNDYQGRLPCFHKRISDSSVIFSREIKFILCYLNLINLDKYGIIEYLSLRYFLGNKTYFSDIKQFRGSSLITNKNGQTTLKSLIKYDFTLNSNDVLNRKDSIIEVKNLILKSVKETLNRIKSSKTIFIDVSGGYDTRLVFTVFSKYIKSIIPITFKLITGDESSVAEQVVNTLDFKITIIDTKRNFLVNNLEEIVFRTDGLVNAYSSISSHQDLLQAISRYAQPIIRINGFGGEFLRHPIKYKRFYKSMEDVIKDEIISPSLVKSSCKILGLNEKEIYNYWKNYFEESYNEESLKDKIMRYYFDYYNKLVSYGEDRQRLLVWPINPLLSNDIINYSTKKINRRFINYKYFEELLEIIEPRVSVKNIKIWDKKFWRSWIFHEIKNSKLLSSIGKRFFKYIWSLRAKKDKTASFLKLSILNYYKNSHILKTIIREEEIRKFFKKENGPRNKFFWQLYTLFCYINLIEKECSLK